MKNHRPSIPCSLSCKITIFLNFIVQGVPEKTNPEIKGYFDQAMITTFLPLSRNKMLSSHTLIAFLQSCITEHHCLENGM
jgi:hypothetical protein